VSGSETSSKTIQPRKLTLPGLKIEAILDVRQQEWMQKALERAEAEQIKKDASTSMTKLVETQVDSDFRTAPTQGARMAYRLLGPNPFPETKPQYIWKACKDPRHFAWTMLFRKAIKNCDALVDRYGCAPAGLSDASLVEQWSLEFFPRAFDACASALLDLITVTADLTDYSQLLWATRRKTLSEAQATLRTTSEATIEAAASVHGGYT
jgi:hypothetical protein